MEAEIIHQFPSWVYIVLIYSGLVGSVLAGSLTYLLLRKSSPGREASSAMTWLWTTVAAVFGFAIGPVTLFFLWVGLFLLVMFLATATN